MHTEEPRKKQVNTCQLYTASVQSFRQFIYLGMWCKLFQSEWQI